MNCIVPIVPGPAGSATAVSEGASASTSLLAATGAGDVTLLVTAALLLASAGILAVLVARRRRNRAQTAPGRSATRHTSAGATMLALGVFLALGVVVSPAPAQAVTTASAESAPVCNVIQVQDVVVDGVPTARGALQVMPGSAPVTVRATVNNLSNAAVSLFIRASAGADTPLAREVRWEAVRGADTASGVLTDTAGQSIGTLAAGGTAEISLTLALPASLGNEFQGQSVDVSVFLTATP